MDPTAWAALFQASTAVEASAVGNWMRSSGWAYPTVNLAHLLGLVLLIGPMLLLDLRLLGLGRHFTLPAVSATLTPWAITGLVLMLCSGALLFAADAGPLIGNPLMQIKLLLIAAGILNALLFRRLWSSRLADWDRHPARIGQGQAIMSALCWLTAGTLGRLVAYG